MGEEDKKKKKKPRGDNFKHKTRVMLPTVTGHDHVLIKSTKSQFDCSGTMTIEAKSESIYFHH